MKPGKSTSEFWLALVAALVPQIMALVVIIFMGTGGLDTQTGMVLIGFFVAGTAVGGGISSFGYSKSRAEVKRT